MQIIEVTGFWVRSAIITLQRPQTPLEFVLFPMVHVASPRFYAEVRRRLADCDLIVAEGIAGESREVSAITLAYRFAPRLWGDDLAEQDYWTVLPPRAPVIAADVTAGQFEADLRKLPWLTHLMLLVAAPVMGLAFVVLGPRAFYRKSLEIDDLPLTAEAEELREGPLIEAIVEKRDRVVLAALEAIYAERCEDRMRVAVVYGAGHMPGIAAGLRARYGYLPRRADWVVVV